MRAIAIAIVVLALDLASKWYVSTNMVLGQSIPVIPGLFHISYIMNPGAAFGILPGQRWFFIAVSALAMAAMIHYAWRPEGRGGLTAIGLGLMLGGAAGNLVDRVRFGRVVDFFEWFWREHYFPAFNVADSAITVGVGLLLVHMLVAARREVSGG